MPRQYRQRIWGVEKVHVPRKLVKYRSRSELLDEHIKAKDYITRDDLNKMSFPNADLVIKNYTRRKGVEFEYIGDGKWVILK